MDSCLKSLKEMSLTALQDLILGIEVRSDCLVSPACNFTSSRYKMDMDVQATQDYLRPLPYPARQDLAKRVQKILLNHDTDEILSNPNMEHAAEWSKHMLWRAACTQSDLIDIPLVLKHVPYFGHFTNHILEYLRKEWDQSIISKSLYLEAESRRFTSEKDERLRNYGCLRHLQIILPKFRRLSEVTLGAGCGNSFLEIIGQSCKSLRKLTLSAKNEVSTSGFIRFAKAQKDNLHLDEIRFLCPNSNISLEGLSQIWLLPLPVKKIHCKAALFWPGSESTKLECPNGPSQLTHMRLDWNRFWFDEQSISVDIVIKVLQSANVIFPSLKSLSLENPPDKLLLSKSGTWKDAVKHIEQPIYSKANIPTLGNLFPNLESLFVKIILCEIDDIGDSFQHLQKLNCTNHFGEKSFAIFCQIIRRLPSLRVISWSVADIFRSIDKFTDEALCQLFHQCDNVTKLEALILKSQKTPLLSEEHVKLQLSNKSVKYILERCPNIKVLGNLQSWSMPEIKIPPQHDHLMKITKLSWQQVKELVGLESVQATPYGIYICRQDLYS